MRGKDTQQLAMFGYVSPEGHARICVVSLSGMVSRIPDEPRFATLTEAPNNERMRWATAGAIPRSLAGVLASAAEKTSKNFGRTDSGMVRP
jgi:hypothetical protein